MKALNIPLPLAHIMALFTAIVWGTTYLATGELLVAFTPIQIMLMRFAIAYIMLWILCPKPLRLNFRDELFCIMLGVIGCTLYFWSENTALIYTQSANVSIFFAASPIVTSVLVTIFVPLEKPKKSMFVGFAIALVGVTLVVFNGTILMKLNPLGDLLAFGSCLCWGTYSFLLRRRATRYNGLQLTRRIILWGFITSLPIAFISGALNATPFSFAPLGDTKMLFCLLFLGMIGSGVCYSLWSTASGVLGSPTVTCYLYLCPFATLIAAFLIKKEKVTSMGLIGTLLILAGVIAAERFGNSKSIPSCANTKTNNSAAPSESTSQKETLLTVSLSPSKISETDHALALPDMQNSKNCSSSSDVHRP